MLRISLTRITETELALTDMSIELSDDVAVLSANSFYTPGFAGKNYFSILVITREADE